MNCTITLTDDQITHLRELLRVLQKDYKPYLDSDYARRLLAARRVLGLSMQYPDAIIDPPDQKLPPMSGIV